MKILVADDSKTNLNLLKHSLEKLGHEVMAVTSAHEAIELFKITRPDLIILDVVMEEMSGFECAKQIRAINEKDWVPIIFLSGSVDNESIAQGIDAGGDDYLTKPFSEVTLAAKIKAMQRIANMRAELYEATQKLTVLSSTDILTGAYNRLMFNKVTKEKIGQAERTHTGFALLFIDLDKFKSINDTYGHHIGDLLLVEVCKRLRQCLRIDDFLARMGGDEFAIIIGSIVDKDIVRIISQKIIDVISQPFDLEGNNITIGTSVGIVFYPSDGTTQEILSKKADFSMYEAKKSGRNNYKYFNEHLNQNPIIKSQETDSLITETNTVLHCLVNNIHICIDLKYVYRTVALPQLHRMPNCPNYMVGLLNLKGKYISVVDLGVCMHMSRTKSYALDNPIILCTDNNHFLGFIVDKILDLSEITNEHIQKQESLSKNSLFLASVHYKSELSLLLNIPYLLTSYLVEEPSHASLNEENSR